MDTSLWLQGTGRLDLVVGIVTVGAVKGTDDDRLEERNPGQEKLCRSLRERERKR